MQFLDLVSMASVISDTQVGDVAKIEEGRGIVPHRETNPGVFEPDLLQARERACISSLYDRWHDVKKTRSVYVTLTACGLPRIFARSHAVCRNIIRIIRRWRELFKLLLCVRRGKNRRRSGNRTTSNSKSGGVPTRPSSSSRTSFYLKSISLVA